jgi:hypothetical protein
MNICDYGCGNEAKFYFKNNKKCCVKIATNCPGRKRKDQHGSNNPMFGKIAWNKGLTKETWESIKINAEKSSKTKLEKFKNGQISWNKGLTKETSESVKINSERCSKTKKGKPNFKLRKPITQSKASCKNHFRNLFKSRLYLIWKKPILERDNYCCSNCGIHNCALEIHHIIPYRQLFQDCITELNYNWNDWLIWTEQMILELENLLVSKHTLEIGITLCKKCHGKHDVCRQKFIKPEKEEK